MAKIDVPYLKLRDGRPRWEPGPKLRERGFRGQDLKDDSGNWLSHGAAIDAAKKINAAVQASAALSEKKPQPAHRTMSALIAEYKRVRKIDVEGEPPEDGTRVGKRKQRLRDKTKRGYAYHLDIIKEWCGDTPAPALSRAAIRDLHESLEDAHGLATANAVMRTLSSLLNFGVDELEWVTKNRAARLNLDQPEGRLVVWEPHEILAILAAADALDLASQGDAFLFGGLTGQRQADVIRLLESARVNGGYTLRQRKGNKLVKVREVAPLRLRIDEARARKQQRWPDGKFRNEFICELTGKPYHPEGSFFRECFRMVRAVAGGLPHALHEAGFAIDEKFLAIAPNLIPCPSVMGKRWQDLRDTAVTLLFAAGCDIAEICTFTGHSLKTAQDILDKHYFVRDDAMSISAGNKLDAYLIRSGW